MTDLGKWIVIHLAYSNGYRGGRVYGQWDTGPYTRDTNAGDHGPALVHDAPHLDRLSVVLNKGKCLINLRIDNLRDNLQ